MINIFAVKIGQTVDRSINKLPDISFTKIKASYKSVLEVLLEIH